MSTSQPTDESRVPWRGVHHIALVTPDLEATIDFYQDVLGMTVLAFFPATNYSGRHAFIQPGDTPTWGLHFFEQPEAQVFAYPAAMPRFAVVPGALQHIAFALPGRADGEALRARLIAHGVTPTPVTTLGQIQNTLFRDNNGLLLEATWPREE